MPSTLTVRAAQGDTLDMLCWRHLGRTAGVVEQALALNAGLAAHGPSLPAGLSVTLPVTNIETSANRETVNLWN